MPYPDSRVSRNATGAETVWRVAVIVLLMLVGLGPGHFAFYVFGVLAMAVVGVIAAFCVED